MELRTAIIGKGGYAVLFTVVIPAGLVWWAWATEKNLPLSAFRYPLIGAVVALAGIAAIIAGVYALRAHAGGLTTRPYPPPRLAVQGIYRFTAHPIYVGFVLLCAGTAIVFGSASGLWLVTPMTALALAAWVLGFERPDLRRRFGAIAARRPLLSLPPGRPDPPTAWDRVSIYVLVFVPWALAFESVYLLGVPPDAIEAYLPFERGWPVLEWTEVIYASVYPYVLATPLLLRSQQALRRMATLGLFSTAIVTLIYLTVPLVAPPRPFEPETVLGRLLTLERMLANTVAAFPAFHVLWSLIAAEAWATRSRACGLVAWTWTSLIALSCLTTGMHALVDLIAAAAFYVALRLGGRLWDKCRRAAEAVANSWREWRWDGVRLINHGFYAAAAAATGVWVSGTLGGADLLWPLVGVHLCALAGAGLWAQWLEGSSKLPRPFGYFGGVLGVATGCAVIALIGGQAMLVLALITVAAPWVQAIGRLRCLVQGCCHGRRAPAMTGIRYWRSKSRVCALADLRGVPLHPTPLYSILANVVIGVVLARLWSLGSPLGVMIGVYLLLSGAARFVEEAYRGEPQTPILSGLGLYQWLAMIAFGVGVAFTAVPGRPPADLSAGFDLPQLVAGLAVGMLVGFAMGVDFPASSRRYARLAPP